MSSDEARVGRPRAVPQHGEGPGPREQVLDAAAALFAEHGYAGTSTRAIAERVGIRQASLYYHFAGKDEILLELLENSVRPSLEFVEPLLTHPDRDAALYALATIDVGTLLATAHNIGTLYLAHEVLQPRFDTFRAHRAELQSAYVELTGSEFDGACCMQLVELVIPMRRDADPGPETAAHVALACLRVAGLDPAEVAAATTAGRELLDTLQASRHVLTGP